jgi:protein-S-isoprenylcysteine O-methyltransferase Ste14
MTKPNKPLLTKTQTGWIWVAMQLMLIVALLAAPKKPVWHAMLGLGWLFFFAGLALFAAAFIALGHTFTSNPVPKHDGELATHGIYRFIRHPMYTAVLLCALGWSMLLGGAWHYIITAALLLFFWAKSDAEERWLHRHYADYADYRARTGRFLPRLFSAKR